MRSVRSFHVPISTKGILAALALSLAFAPRFARGDEPPATPDKEKPAADSGKATDNAKATDNGKAAKADDEETSEAPAHRYPPSGVRTALILGGATLTLGSYGATLGAAFGWPDVPGASYLKIPIAGPWIALSKFGCTPPDTSCTPILVTRTVLEVLSGLIQPSGLPLIAEGIFMTTEAAPKEKAPKSAALDFRFTVIPVVTPTMTGVGIIGTF